MATMKTRKSTLEKEMKMKVFEDFSIDYGRRNGLKIRKLKLDVIGRDHNTKVQKLSLGKPSPICPTKVVLLIGGSGHGKTTLINTMANYIYGVNYEDDFRFILMDAYGSQSDGQTDYLTAYAFNYQNGMPFAYNYVLIDTPGYGDRDMIDQLEFFLNKDDYGINHVNAVGIVTPASSSRLTGAQQHILCGLSSMFGADVEDAIYIMSTFSDTEDPQILAVLREAKICYNDFYKFNNSAIYANNKLSSRDCPETEAENVVNRRYWTMGFKSLHRFYLKLEQTPPVSLKLTREVLSERRNLQSALFKLQSQIHFGLSKLSTLHQERDMLSLLKEDIKGCANYEQEIEIPKTEKMECFSENRDQGSIGFSFNPLNKNFGFNYSWNKESKNVTNFSVKWVKEKRTVKELLDRYNLALSNCADKESLVQRLEKDIENFAKDLIELIKRAKMSVDRLQQIALVPNSISTKEYIELFIASEKREKSYNFQKRIDILDLLKREYEAIFCTSGSSSIGSSRGGKLLLEYIKKQKY